MLCVLQDELRPYRSNILKSIHLLDKISNRNYLLSYFKSNHPHADFAVIPPFSRERGGKA
jgi:hypothetical protein